MQCSTSKRVRVSPSLLISPILQRAIDSKYPSKNITLNHTKPMVTARRSMLRPTLHCNVVIIKQFKLSYRSKTVTTVITHCPLSWLALLIPESCTARYGRSVYCIGAHHWNRSITGGIPYSNTVPQDRSLSPRLRQRPIA